MSRLFLWSLLLAGALAGVARGEHRHALLIGNGKYPKAELVTPPNDIRAIGEALAKRGFVVTQLEDLTAEKMRSAFDAFARSVPTRGTALIYFSGYALPNRNAGDPNADNSLLPIDGNPANAGAVNNSQTGVVQLLNRFAAEGGSARTILIVDGCIRHPSRAADAPLGLVKTATKLPADTRIIFAAPMGEAAAPEREGLSPLARKLSADLNSPKPLNAFLDGLAPTQESTLADLAALAPPASRVIALPVNFQPGSKAGDEWVNPLGMVFCWCPPGRFTMGSAVTEVGRDEDEIPAEAAIPEGFWMAKFEFTRGELKALTKQSGTYLSTGDHKLYPLNKFRGDFPTTLLAKLNETAPAGWQYALPTEVEWEYAARAGTKTAYYFGDEAAELGKHGNFADRTLRESTSVGEVGKTMKTKPFLGDTQAGLFTYAHKTWNDGVANMALVGSYRPNPWGLHDMCGNMAELTSTPYHPQRTPPEKFDARSGWVCKGGSWISPASSCRSAARGQFTFLARENQTENYLGLRFILKKK